MTLTAEQLIEVRVWLPWDPPTDADLSTRYDAIGSTSYWPLVKEQLRMQYMRLLMTPAQLTIPGEYGQGTGTNMAELRLAMKEVDKIIAEENLATAGADVAQLVRPNPYRAGRTRVQCPTDVERGVSVWPPF